MPLQGGGTADCNAVQTVQVRLTDITSSLQHVQSDSCMLQCASPCNTHTCPVHYSYCLTEYMYQVFLILHMRVAWLWGIWCVTLTGAAAPLNSSY
jgi:hypothetical protein